MIDWMQLIHDAEADGLNWDFYEQSPSVEKDCWNTVPGRIVSAFGESGSGKKPIGLLAAYAARRSLACWFAYCESKEPLRRIDQVIEYWLSGSYENQITAYTEGCTPTINGKEIIDCRSEDTMAASNAVANAAKFALTNKELDAITAISHAYIAFDVTPITSVKTFRNWLVQFAIPTALAGERMTPAAFEALADYEFSGPPIETR